MSGARQGPQRGAAGGARHQLRLLPSLRVGDGPREFVGPSRNRPGRRRLLGLWGLWRLWRPGRPRLWACAARLPPRALCGWKGGDCGELGLKGRIRRQAREVRATSPAAPSRTR